MPFLYKTEAKYVNECIHADLELVAIRGEKNGQ